MPPIDRALNGTLGWLLASRTHDRSLERGPDDPAERDADAAGLQALAPAVSLPPPFRRFIEDPGPRRHVRSATSCYLDLAHDAIRVDDGGMLIHFLSDQQWVLHWLLYLGPDGSEAVVVSPEPFGFREAENVLPGPLELGGAEDVLAVCADSFEEFLYRFWIENELFFRLAVDGTPFEALPADLRAYAARYADGPRRGPSPS
jgi:hypothetical protein